jgi:hypothetical protein
VGALSPPPFSLEHPPQGLTAGGAAKLLARAATTQREVLVTAGTIAAKKFGIPGWALTLAGLRRARAARIRCRREHFLGSGGLPTFRAATSPPPALSLPVFPSLGGLPVLPAGAPLPPAPRGGPALRAAIASLGMGGMKGLLASLEETPSLPRPTRPLTGPGIAASWCRAQGSGELPTAKPRARSPYLRPEAPFRIDSALVGVRDSPA